MSAQTCAEKIRDYYLNNEINLIEGERVICVQENEFKNTYGTVTLEWVGTAFGVVFNTHVLGITRDNGGFTYGANIDQKWKSITPPPVPQKARTIVCSSPKV